MSFRILQLSDLHFGPKNYYKQTVNPMRQAVDAVEDIYLALTKNKIVPVFNAVLLSGDFTWGGDPVGFDIAERFVSCLEWAEMCTRKMCLLIPGNHDITWSTPEGQPVAFTREAAERQYRSFVSRLGVPALSDHGSLGFVSLFKAARMVLIGLNSARLESSAGKGVGYVGFDQIFAVMEAARKSHLEKTVGGDVLLASLHHHLYPTYDLPVEWVWNRWQPSMTLDALGVLRALDQFGFRAVFHGHMHKRTFHNDVIEQTETPGGRQLPVLGAGSLCVDAKYCEDNNPRHHFHVIEQVQRLLVVHHLTAPASSPRNWTDYQQQVNLGRVDDYIPSAPEVRARHVSVWVPLEFRLSTVATF